MKKKTKWVKTPTKEEAFDSWLKELPEEDAEQIAAKYAIKEEPQIVEWWNQPEK